MSSQWLRVYQKRLIKNNMTKKQKLIAMSILYSVALILLGYVDWRVAVGAFVLLTAHQVEKH